MILCKGTECPKKDSCKRHKENINTKREDYLDSVPYNKEKQRCGFYLGIEENALLEHVKDILEKYPKTKFLNAPANGDE